MQTWAITCCMCSHTHMRARTHTHAHINTHTNKYNSIVFLNSTFYASLTLTELTIAVLSCSYGSYFSTLWVSDVLDIPAIHVELEMLPQSDRRVALCVFRCLWLRDVTARSCLLEKGRLYDLLLPCLRKQSKSYSLQPCMILALSRSMGFLKHLSVIRPFKWEGTQSPLLHALSLCGHEILRIKCRKPDFFFSLFFFKLRTPMARASFNEAWATSSVWNETSSSSPPSSLPPFFSLSKACMQILSYALAVLCDIFKQSSEIRPGNPAKPSMTVI